MAIWLCIVLTGVFGALSAPGAQLTLQAVDDDGEPVWARFEIRGEDGKMYQPLDALRDRTATHRSGEGWYLGGFVARGPSTVELPAGEYTVAAERGTEWERFEEPVTVSEEQPAELTIHLEPWVDMNKLGWWSADFHVHRTIEDTANLILAENLNLAVIFTLWNQYNYWDLHEVPENPVLQMSPERRMTVLNAEDERGGGAWMLHGLRELIDISVEDRWYPPGIQFVFQAREQKYYERGLPWFDVEKPFWWETPVMMALAEPDSIGILHNHFNQYGMLDNEAWGRPRDTEKYPGPEGFAEASFDLYYRYWNLGYRVPPSAGSASGVLPNPVGYNRVYVKMDEPYSVHNWYLAFREGPSFVTNGPMLFFEAYELPDEVRLLVDARSREPLDRIEIVANGQIVSTIDVPEGQTSYQAELGMESGVHTWVAARCYTRNPHTIRMAHSRPVRLVDGSWDAAGDARFFVQWMDELIAQTGENAERFDNEEQRQEVLRLYNMAREEYLKKAEAQ